MFGGFGVVIQTDYGRPSIRQPLGLNRITTPRNREAVNLINRDFQAGTPNEKWLTDITAFQIPAGKVYLSPLIDCFDGLVVSWTIGTRPDAAMVNTMLDAAIQTIAARRAG